MCIRDRPYSDETLILNTRNIDIVLGGHSHSYFDKTLFYKNLDGKEIDVYKRQGYGGSGLL